jgi:CRP-like cAMP-binding protein
MVRNGLILLGQISDTDTQWLLEVGERRTLRKGEVLIWEGRSADALTFLLEGKLTVEAAGEVLAHLGVGEVVGEMSFVDADPPTATVRVEMPSQILCVSKERLTERMAAEMDFAARFYRAMAVVLSSRLRTMDHLQKSNEPFEDAELDAGVIETLNLAGSRFDDILRRFLPR